MYASYEAVDGEDGGQPAYAIPPPVTAAGLATYQDADDIGAHVVNPAGPQYVGTSTPSKLCLAASRPCLHPTRDPRTRPRPPVHPAARPPATRLPACPLMLAFHTLSRPFTGTRHRQRRDRQQRTATRGTPLLRPRKNRTTATCRPKARASGAPTRTLMG